ncbi:PHD finger protein 11 [Sphaerodactylus townsendi]|uniref:PHD finger protein 11 n=1 Tax=Sphaerodactylus townsendi TaxID=933632 RepID=UPI002025F816|nr:PHD finger protein 11 [Sphaerodactylus townsendi]
MAKMLRRQCAFCPGDEESSVLYVAEGQNLAVHQDCLLYSSGFVESEEHNPENLDIRFDVASVVNELKRGRRLVSYQSVVLQYSLLMFLDEDNKRERSPITVKSSPAVNKMSETEKIEEDSLHALRKKQDRQKVRVEFLRKCKRAGLLDEIFEEMLDTLHLAQEKLMDDNTSEAEYEETVISLFDCGLFENILVNANSGTEEKIQKLLEKRKRLDTQIELLKDLQVVLPAPEESSDCTSE